MFVATCLVLPDTECLRATGLVSNVHGRLSELWRFATAAAVDVSVDIQERLVDIDIARTAPQLDARTHLRQVAFHASQNVSPQLVEQFG